MTHALIVENDRYSVEILANLLQQLNIEVTGVNAADQIDPATLPDMDLIFLDLDLPGMDGFVVYNILRHDYGITAPIIAYTVNTNERATVRQMGFNGMLPKPIDFDCFRTQMAHLMAGEEIWGDC